MQDLVDASNHRKIRQRPFFRFLSSSQERVMTNVDSQITMKLFIDNDTGKVMFVEAEKNFVDLIFNLLTLPVGSITNLVTPSLMVASIGNLYQSVERLNEKYVVGNKAVLLQPKTSSIDDIGPFLEPTLKYYLCLLCRDRIATAIDINCPCGGKTNQVLEFIVPSGSSSSPSKGYVKEFVKYTITDDLNITPISAESIMRIMSRFNLKNHTQLKVKDVTVGKNEVVALFAASLKSSTALSDVFLPKKEKDCLPEISERKMVNYFMGYL